MVHSASVLTPGSPGYALLKLGAVGGVFGLRVVLARRSRPDAAPPAPAEAPARRTAAPHPVSRAKAQRRRRKRRA